MTEEDSATTSGPGQPSVAWPERRREIIEAAAHLFEEKGFSRTSTQDIADAVGILKGSLYHHIKSKEDLLNWIIEEVHYHLEANVQSTRAAAGSPAERVEHFVVGHIEIATTWTAWGRVYNQDLDSLGGERRKQIFARRDEYERFFRELIKEAQSVGELRADIDAHLAAIAVLTLLNSLYRWYRLDGAFSAAAIRQAYCGLIMRGLAVA